MSLPALLGLSLSEGDRSTPPTDLHRQIRLSIEASTEIMVTEASLAAYRMSRGLCSTFENHGELPGPAVVGCQSLVFTDNQCARAWAYYGGVLHIAALSVSHPFSARTVCHCHMHVQCTDRECEAAAAVSGKGDKNQFASLVGWYHEAW